MVRLSKIYTKTGDDGTTGLGDGSRVSKTSLRVEAYGTVDEANATIGLAVVQAAQPGPATHPRLRSLAALLRTVQNDLFDVGADLCCPPQPGEQPRTRLRTTPAQVRRLEDLIDEHNERLRPLDSFVLPGGTPLAATLHLARTVVRRAERLTIALRDAEPDRVSAEAVIYLNRLSDLLFVLARVANEDGALDVKWIPGSTAESAPREPGEGGAA